MTGIHSRTYLYEEEKNQFLKNAKDLVPRIVTYLGDFAFCLMERHDFKTYYCFLSIFGFSDMDEFHRGDVIKKLSFEDYFKTSNRLRQSNVKFNLRKIIYDSNRNK